MSASLDTLMQHFQGINRQNIIAAGEAFVDGSFEAFQSVVERVRDLEVTESIANLVSTSRSEFNDFLTRFQEMGTGGKVCLGTLSAMTGGFVLSSAAALASFFGVSVFVVTIVAVALLLWGVVTALTNIRALVLTRIGSWEDNLAALNK